MRARACPYLTPLVGSTERTRVAPHTAQFDYNLHMAIQQIPNDEYDEGIVCSEAQPGYTCKGQLVRAAYVMVSAG